MPYENLLREKKIIQKAINRIRALKLTRQLNIMEVCGTHTYTFFRFGLRNLLPKNINLISGPGCPVCITEDVFIDKVILLCRDKDNIIATFGDLIKVKGTNSSLEEERSKGANVEVVYSPLDAIELAVNNPVKRIIFLGVGFETTAPLSASVLKEAKKLKLKNFFILSAHRIIPPAIDALCSDKDINIDGLLCPGHVSAIIGEASYKKVVSRFHKPCVICGFEPLDMIFSIYKICVQLKENTYKFENEYTRVVKPQGNPKALKAIKEVFKIEDASWRGFGLIKNSGLGLNKKYKEFDAEGLIDPKKLNSKKTINNCRCADVVKGKIKPTQCPLFRKKCSPDNPKGPCMISFEGSCRIYYEYSA